MTKQKWSLQSLFYFALSAIFTGLFFNLALNKYYGDSEIWLLTLSQNVASPQGLNSIYYKYVFHWLTYLFSHAAPSELAVYTWARIGWATVSVVSLFLVARFYSRTFRFPQLFWPLYLFLITSHVFFNRAFEVRGDVLCLLMHSLFMNLFVVYSDRPRKFGHIALLTLINLLLIGATPKGVIFLVVQVIFCAALSFKSPEQQKKRMLWLTWMSHASPLLVVSVALSLLAAISPNSHWIEAIANSLDFYLKSFDTRLLNTHFFGRQDFHYIVRFIILSWPHALVMLAWLVLFYVAAFRRKKNSTPHLLQGLQIAGMALLVLVLLYNQKLPFFLGPFLTPVLALAFCSVFTTLPIRLRVGRETILACLILCCLYRASVQYYVNIAYNQNTYQRELIADLEDYIQRNPRIDIYDVIGLLPRKNKIFAFIGPSEVARKTAVIDKIKQYAPHVILETFKTSLLDPQMRHFLVNEFVPLEPNVWFQGTTITSIDNPEYFKKKVMIDGKEYWLMEAFSNRYVLNLLDRQILNPECLLLDENQTLTESNPRYVAVPSQYIALALTDVPKLNLRHSPFVLFRYDTSF